MPRKYRESSETTLRTYIPVSLKILKKWTNDHPKLNQEDIKHLHRSITQNETEAEIKSLPKKKSP
jgi:uncharacterized protein YneF (UPF0154 family)